MACKEIVPDAADGPRLIEVRQPLTRGLSVSRDRLSTPGKAGGCELMTLRRAKAAFRVRVAKAHSCVPAGTEPG